MHDRENFLCGCVCPEMFNTFHNDIKTGELLEGLPTHWLQTFPDLSTVPYQQPLQELCFHLSFLAKYKKYFGNFDKIQLQYAGVSIHNSNKLITQDVILIKSPPVVL